MEKKDSGPLRVKVLHALPARTYQNAKKREMTVIECVVADTTGVVKMSAYNKTSFPMLQPGQSIMILNLICKPREVVLTSEAKVLLIPALEINEEILVSGEQLFNQMKNPTGAASKTILEILDLPPGTLVSCIVKVVEVK